MPKKKIQVFCEQIEIPYLTHFTRTENLPSILKHGLYPVSRFDELGSTPITNDELRLDGHLDGISLSISFPNSQMFYRYRMDDPDVRWSVLVLSPSILWEKECAFCKHNAADGRISCQRLENLSSPEAFQDLYLEIDGIKTRKEQLLKPCDPTDVQAEILVLGTIEPKYIACICFDSADDKKAYAESANGKKLYFHGKNKGLFSARSYARQYTNL